jgi:hypothetical protein
MKIIGIISTAALSLLFGIAAPTCAQQEQHEQQQEQKDKPSQPQEKHAQQEERKAQPDKPGQRDGQAAQQEDRHAQPEKARQEKAQQDKPAQREEQHAKDVRPAQQDEHQARQENQHAQQPARGNEQPRRTQEQQRVQQSAWQQHRSQRWDSDHRTWQQRGGYNGYRIPDDRFRGYFGPEHGFRIYGLPFLVVGGYPRFQYGGYWVSTVDPWPEYWAADWYDTDDVYVTYVDNGYYLFNRRYPNVGIAISISL